MSPKWPGLCPLMVVLLSACIVAFSGIADAQTYSVIYRFRGGTDGQAPFGGLIQDSAGNLYGTTEAGGATNCGSVFTCGTVFKLAADGTETVLHVFQGGSDGLAPIAGLVMDNAGNLYGTTPHGGSGSDCAYDQGCGTVFEISSTGAETIVYSFCSQANCSDGNEPEGALFADPAGNLYGTTFMGGPTGGGTVFEIPAGGAFTVLYSFQGYPDGNWPRAGVTMDGAGNLYGTTSSGGDTDGMSGTVFELSKAGAESVLYSFCECGAGGYSPVSVPALDMAGNIFGTTDNGGDNDKCLDGDGCGVVFELTPDNGTYNETVLHDFGNDGNPFAGITLDGAGHKFGVGCGSVCTEFPGGRHCAKGCYNGEAYEISSALSPYVPGRFRVLHAFGGGGGSNPAAPLLLSHGVIYGTTVDGGYPCEAGGGTGCGTVYKISNALPADVTTR
jgi:uncharacterized repeat protein (TIGR03803 family)